MPTYVAASLRRSVADRADRRCEYCRFPESFALHPHEPDHVVPQQHGGATEESNLALACLPCNRYKGPNVGSYDPVSGALVPLFNPRTQEWLVHFARDGALIRPLTAEARVTVRILRLNDPDRVADRERLMRLGAL